MYPFSVFIRMRFQKLFYGRKIDFPKEKEKLGVCYAVSYDGEGNPTYHNSGNKDS